MVIVCPNCSVSYHIDPASLGTRGRTVRCAGCRHLWHVSGPAEAVDADEGTFGAPEDEAAGAGQDAMPALSEPQVPRIAVEDVETAAKREQPTRPLVRAAPKPRPRSRPVLPRPRLATIVAAGGILTLAAALYWRTEVVRYVPDTAGLYQAIGLPVNIRGLALSDIKTNEITENGVPHLVVTGTIRNVRETAMPVPRLRLAVHGPTNREIYVWTTTPQRSELAAGEAILFWSQLASPPVEGREVSVRFFGRRDIAMGMAQRVDP